ncbi:DUF1980 domain-containing protein [Microbacterium sp. NPDC078428]|uniref:TIGR03943 family putative permease subunit n=1 Tax=Microbacterium sp. NPDC078428 TaxID=3364190 RepID=UPI0037C6F19D
MPRGSALGMRWLGVGLAAALAVVTLGLWVTGRIGLYINPDSAWWAVAMSAVLLVLAVASCGVRIEDDAEHEHEHDDPGSETADPAEAAPAGGLRRSRPRPAASPAPRPLLGAVASAAGGVIASAFVLLAIATPPASLSSELALARTSGAAPVLSTSATLALASSDDTSNFGIGEWASVIATTTDPTRFVGEPASLVGFVSSTGDTDGFSLTRLVIVHCVIDAQSASVPVSGTAGTDDLEDGQWVEVRGAFSRSASGGLVLEPVDVEPVDEPEDPYEY